MTDSRASSSPLRRTDPATLIAWRLEDFDRTMLALESHLLVRSIMSSPLETIAPEADAREWFAEREDVGFDCAPVEEDGRIIGMVSVDDARRAARGTSAKELMDPLPEVPLVADSETIANLVREMRATGNHFWLVLSGTRIDGIVTRSDLWKLPVRLLAMTMLVHIEQLLTELIQRDCPDDQWLPLLPKNQQKRILSLAGYKRARNENLELIESTSFSDKREIVRLALQRDALAAELEALTPLRNLLMHAMVGSDEQAGVDELLLSLGRLEATIAELHGELVPGNSMGGDSPVAGHNPKLELGSYEGSAQPNAEATMTGEANVNHGETFPAALDAAATLARQLCDRFVAEVPAGTRAGDPDKIVIDRSMDFVAQCMDACVLLARAGFLSQALIVCRSAYECGVRLLWATSRPDGWARFQRHWAEMDIKWARDAESIMPGDHPATVLQSRQEVLDRRDAAGEPFVAAPPMLQMLKDIEEADVAAGRCPAGQKGFLFQYAQFYRILSGLSHGHPSMIAEQPEEAHWPHLAVIAVTAVAGVRLAHERYCEAHGLEPSAEAREANAELTKGLEKAADQALEERDKE